MELRTGYGFDVHAFRQGRKLVLCGVEIPCEGGLDGHSDADVATHALMDSVLGALALGDIGQWFPDNDDKWLGANSMEMLACLLKSDRISGWEFVNGDITIIAQHPKLSSFRDTMRNRLADVIGCAVDRISVKFTTTERLGFTGRGEGIAATASVLLERKNR